eukprot:SAG11_NODE_1822_length_4207_cov_1.736125_10_plen_59_part_01
MENGYQVLVPDLNYPKGNLGSLLTYYTRVSRGSFRQFDGLHDPTLSKTEIQAQTQDEKL